VEQPAAERPAAEQPAAEQPAPATEATQQPIETAQPTEPAPAQTEVAKNEPPAAAEVPASTEQPQQPPAQDAAVVEQPANTEEAATDQTAETTPPSTQQDTSKQVQETVAATASDSAGPAQPKEGRIVIQPGNNLWRISRVLYGNGNKFTMLYEANKDQIRNPNLIYPGQVFRTPEVAPRANTIDPHRREPLTPDENAGAAE
jgi:nucleoid-associated protein YgaU